MSVAKGADARKNTFSIDDKLTVNCHHEEKRRLKILAAEEGMNMSELLRVWIAQGWQDRTERIAQLSKTQ